MSEFEDPELARMLGRAGGAYPDVNAGYERWRSGVRRAQRRRVAVVGSMTTGLLLTAGIALANFSAKAPEVQPSTRDSLTSSLPDTVVDSSSPDDSTGTSTDNTTQTSTENTTGTSTSGSTNSSPPTTSNTPPVTRVFSGIGGTITVRMENNTLTLVSYSASAGYSAEIDDSSGDRVEVRFESPDHETRVRVEIEDGEMKPEIEEGDG